MIEVKLDSDNLTVEIYKNGLPCSKIHGESGDGPIIVTEACSSFLAGKRFYLSGPIEHSSCGNWRLSPKKVLVEEFKIDLYDPFEDPKQIWVQPLDVARAAKDYETMTRIAKMFVRKDLASVDRADVLVACLPHRVPTTGTHHEIINSNNAKKPTLLVCLDGKEKVPAWYYGFVPHEFMFGSWEELYAYLREVNAGLHKNNDRWAFVYGLV